MADAVTAELRGLGVEVSEDGAAEAAGAGRRQPPRPAPAGARMGGSCSPPTSTRFRTRAGSRWSSPTASTAAPARRSSAPTTRPRSRCCSSWPRAHAGDPPRGRGRARCSRSPRRMALRGAKGSTSRPLRSPFGFVLDHASPIGEVIIASPTYQRLDRRVRGDRGPRRDPARGRPQRDRGGRRGDRARWSSAGSTRRRRRTSG